MHGRLWVMRAAGNSFFATGFAALEVSLTALTALQSLDLGSKHPCFFGV